MRLKETLLPFKFKIKILEKQVEMLKEELKAAKDESEMRAKELAHAKEQKVTNDQVIGELEQMKREVSGLVSR